MTKRKKELCFKRGCTKPATMQGVWAGLVVALACDAHCPKPKGSEQKPRGE